MPEPKRRPTAKPDRAAVVTKAALRAASQLGMTNKVFANVVGLSDATVSRMRAGQYELQADQKSFESWHTLTKSSGYLRSARANTR